MDKVKLYLVNFADFGVLVEVDGRVEIWNHLWPKKNAATQPHFCSR